MSRSESTASESLGSKIAVTLFLGLFGLVGVGLTGVMVWSFFQTLRPYFWSQTPCTIVQSERPSDGLEKTSNSDEPILIRYRYEAGGRNHESNRLDMGMSESLDSREIERLLTKYQKEGGAVCYVNLKNPEEAALRRGPLWPIVFVFIPLLFAGIGIGGITAIWRGKRSKPRVIAEGQKSKGTKNFGTIVMSSVFILVGGTVTFFIVVQPLQKYFAAKNWPETPCKILSSKVGSHRGNKGGTTYSIDITYRYRADGREFRSDDYSIMFGSTSGRDSKKRIVAKYPAGSEAVCYVNPNDPTDALLNRGLSPWMFIGLLPVTFFLTGLFGIGSVIHSGWKGALARSSVPVLPGVSGVTPASSTLIAPPIIGPVELKPEVSRVGLLLGAMLITAFWNGLVGTFVWLVVSSFMDGKPEWVPAIFLIPFVVIGLIIFGYAVGAFLNLFTPRLRLAVNSPEIPLGGKLDASWAFEGSARRIKHFKLTLEGREETTTGSGKGRRTDRNVFATLPLIDTTDPQQIAQGHASVEIPTEYQPTDDEGAQKVVWRLKANQEIPRFPSFEEEYEVTVLAREVR